MNISFGDVTQTSIQVRITDFPFTPNYDNYIESDSFLMNTEPDFPYGSNRGISLGNIYDDYTTEFQLVEGLTYNTTYYFKFILEYIIDGDYNYIEAYGQCTTLPYPPDIYFGVGEVVQDKIIFWVDCDDWSFFQSASLYKQELVYNEEDGVWVGQGWSPPTSIEPQYGNIEVEVSPDEYGKTFEFLFQAHSDTFGTINASNTITTLPPPPPPPEAPTLYTYPSINYVDIDIYKSDGVWGTDFFFGWDSNGNVISIDISVADYITSGTTVKFEGLLPNTTYSFAFCAETINYVRGDIFFGSFTTLPIPETPTLAITPHKNSVSIEITKSDGVWGTDFFFGWDSNGKIISINTSGANYITSGTEAQFTGLLSDTTYWFAYCAESIDYIRGNIEYISFKTLGIKPDNWYWSKTDSEFNSHSLTISSISSAEWNDFIDRVNEFRDYKGYSQIPEYVYISRLGIPVKTKMDSNKILYAERFNAVRQAIGEMYSTGITDKYYGSKVYGWYFVTIKNSLNSIT